MNDSSDELRAIWQAGAAPAVDVEGVLKRMEQKSADFKRMISRRDLREMAAGLFIAILFSWFAYGASDWLMRASDLWIAASGLWIIYWLRRHSHVQQAPPRDQSLSGYHRALSDSYKQQIWLLRTAKLWYVLPLWTGLMLFSLATWRIRHNLPALLVLVATFTATFGFVWWLNESWGVRHLRRKQDELGKLVSGCEV